MQFIILSDNFARKIRITRSRRICEYQEKTRSETKDN